MHKAIWNNQIIAQSDKTVVVEGNHYFPMESVRQEFLKESSHQSRCHWKGLANYYSLEVDGKINENAVWYYAEPSEAAKEIKNRVAFWKGVQIITEVE
ncbi:DUF427 domain-containing protein [Haliscomenobacter sp.]|jgi:uncharacterized protein (DUF427 family)|uniref:DUF427 domain-containing protein n=1 Tax=Haliscomenobacter sp. TaxID=2717303 RepID=UPI0035943984